MEEKKTVVLDFDGVIHSYKSGWQGSAVIPDEPVPGIKRAIEEIRYCGYEVCVVSTRCATAWGMEAVANWLAQYNIIIDKLCAEKPPAVCYVDDRAICFDGHRRRCCRKSYGLSRGGSEMKSCRGCEYFRIEQWERGKCATRCMMPTDTIFGNGRTLDVYSVAFEGVPPVTERPRSCPKEKPLRRFAAPPLTRGGN